MFSLHPITKVALVNYLPMATLKLCYSTEDERVSGAHMALDEGGYVCRRGGDTVVTRVRRGSSDLGCGRA